MTLRARVVRVPLTAQAAREIRVWLGRWYRSRPTLTTDTESAARGNELASDLGRELDRASKWRRRTHIELSRPLAEWAAGLAVFCLYQRWSDVVYEFAATCNAVVTKRRGRPRLKQGHALVWIETRSGDPRQRRRLKRRVRLDRWVDALAARRETLLTATDSPPDA